MVAYNVLFNLGDTMVQWFVHWALGQDVLVWPFNSQDLISDSLCYLPYNSYDFNLENLVLLDSVSIM